MFFLKLTIEEYNFCNNYFGFIIPDSCDNDIRQSLFSFCRGGRPPSQVLGEGARRAAPPSCASAQTSFARNANKE